MPITVAELQEGLIKHDKGVLKYGSHKPDSREFCVLEFSSIMRGKPFSDSPIDMPDVRGLNDMFGRGDEADQLRTKHLLPVMAALWDWNSWSKTKQQVWVIGLAIATVNQIIADLPGLPENIRVKCRTAKTLDAAAADAAAARYAAAAAADAARYAARYAAAAAADAARYAAAAAAARYAAAAAAARYAAADDAARYAAAARFKVCIKACEVWLEVCNSVEGIV